MIKCTWNKVEETFKCTHQKCKDFKILRKNINLSLRYNLWQLGNQKKTSRVKKKWGGAYKQSSGILFRDERWESSSRNNL